MGEHRATFGSDSIAKPRGAGLGLAGIAAFIVTCIFAMHFLAPEPVADTAQTQVKTVR